MAAAGWVSAQDNKKEDTVKLISAKSAQLIEENGENYRKVVGPARFLHNDTYLLCDTALWNVNTNVIDAMGHVRIIQDRTKLSSSTLQYVVDENMARFRGDLVQLEDSDKNMLRTRYLDYSTQDSVAVFQDGAAMRDKDGQVIESLYGTYDAKAKLFVFNDQVNMYMDTTFVKTSRLEYRSDLSTAWFGFGTDMWQDDKMLSANDGWYDRSRELFLFRRNVHLLTEDQETWSDSLWYHRAIGDMEMLGNVELMDTTRNVFALAGRVEYCDSLEQIQMTREPAVMSISDEKGRRDTLYLGGNLLKYRSIRMCDIPDSEIKGAETRQKAIGGDPVMEYRKKAAEAAAKAAEEAAENAGGGKPGGKGGIGDKDTKGDKGDKLAGDIKEAPKDAPKDEPKDEPKEPPRDKPKDAPIDKPKEPSIPRAAGRRQPQADTSAVLPSLPDTLALTAPADSLTLTPPADTLALTTPADTLATPTPEVPDAQPIEEEPVKKEEAAPAEEGAADTPPAETSEEATSAEEKTVVEEPKDTTKVGFIWGSQRVRMFRKDMQMAADSLVYNDLDSLFRLYQTPIFYNEGNRQYAADSIYMVVRDRRMEKAHLLSNAFITIQEEPHSFDQIRGTEMVAYFDSTSALTRFDALGGASTLFFLEENDALATVNKVEAKMIYATFKDGDIERMYYYDNPKNDGYPAVQLPEDDRTLKGFRWEPELRPASPRDVTSLVPRKSQRTSYLARPHADFKQTNTYFPGYIKKVYREIALRDSLKVVRQRELQRRKDSLARAEADSLLALTDTLQVPADSLAAAADSLLKTPADSLKATADSLLKAPADSLKAAADSLMKTPTDSLAATTPHIPTIADLKAQKEAEKAAREAEKARKKAEKQAALEAKWAEEDRIYEEKQAAKAQKKLDKERARKLKALRKLEKRAQKDRARFEKYLRREREKAQKAKQLTD